MTIKFNKDFKSWQEDYETTPIYTKKQMENALSEQAKKLRVNRVVKSLTGLYGPTESIAMQILHVHYTEEGVLVIVK